MVGSTLRWFRRESSDCFCIELSVCEVAREILGVLCVEDSDEVEPELRLATRCAVLGGSADIFMGGRAAGGSTFFGPTDERVCHGHNKHQTRAPHDAPPPKGGWRLSAGKIMHSLRTLPRFLPISTEIRLSLLSFSFSSLCRCFSASFAARASSFAVFASLFSLSECRLLRELEPLSSDGKPNTDDFLCAEFGVDGVVGSLGGDTPLGGRRYDDVPAVGWC